MGERIDVLVVGAGVVGLAVARALARAGQDVLVAERHDAIGTEVSARNSEVIHAGIYYPPGSLRARLCTAGRDALYAFCASHGVGHRRTGKLIVAAEEADLPALDAIVQAGRANGVADLERIDAPAARARAPALRTAGAVWSPSTGIVDSHGLMLFLRGAAEALGATIALQAPVKAITPQDRGYRVQLDNGGEDYELSASIVINAAGLGAPAVATSIDGLDARHVPRHHLAKGSYFTLAGRSPFDTLVYPIPEAGGLGIHLTLDLAGQARFGPDVELVDHLDYAVDAARAAAFYAAIRRYWPGLPDGALVPGYSGIRPRITAPGEPAADFVIQGVETHGMQGLVNLFGIESPGLTASLAIAAEVTGRLGLGPCLGEAGFLAADSPLR